MILAIATAFVVGSIATATTAFADHFNPCDFQGSANVKKVTLADNIWHAICGLQEQIDTIELTPGPPGPPGDDGTDGADGDPGVLNFYHMFGTVETVEPGAFAALTASCLSGDHLTGGGHQVTIGVGAPQVRISAPLTASPSDTWEVQLFNPNPDELGTQNVRAVVICADLP